MAPLLCLSIAVQASAASFLVRAESTPSSAHLELQFSEETHCTSETLGNRELLLQCDRPIDPPPMDEVLAQMSTWIAWISNGYDTLLIHSARDLNFALSSPASRQIVVELIPVKAERVAENSSALVPVLLKSRLLTATGKPSAAAKLLRQALASNPEDGQLLSELAEVELRANRWRYAADLYSMALLNQPRNEDLITVREKVLREHGPAVSYETISKNVQDDRSEFLTSASAEWPLSIPTKVGFRIEQNHFRSLESSQPDAAMQTRSRIEASLQHDFFSGSVLTAALVSNGPEAGGRISYSQSGMSGSTHLETSYGIAFWDLLSSLKGYGMRDRVTAGRTQQVSTRLAAQFNVAVNRYRMGNAVLARTYGTNGSLNYTLRKRYPAIEIDYLVDVEKRADHLISAGFPLSNRNVHAIGTAMSAPIGRKTDLFASTGMSIDLDGGRGPFIAARVNRRFTERLSAEVWTERRRNSVLTGRVVTSLGAKIVFALRAKELP